MQLLMSWVLAWFTEPKVDKVQTGEAGRRLEELLGLHMFISLGTAARVSHIALIY